MLQTYDFPTLVPISRGPRKLNKIASRSGLKSLNIDKETFSKKNDVL